jgi:hypothetical protein
MMLAEISGNSIVEAFIGIVVVGLICWLLWWFISYIGLPEPFNKVARVIVALVAVVFLIDFLLSLIGHGFIRRGG